MSKIAVNVDPGICGLKSRIVAESADGMTASVELVSDCPDIQRFNGKLDGIDAMTEVFKPFGESVVYKLAKEYCKHAVCPVPGAILKAIEASCGFALAKDVHIEIAKMD